MADFIIDDEDPKIDHCFDPVINGERKGRGYVPREQTPPGPWNPPKEMFSPPTEITPIPKSEWSARIKHLKDVGGSLNDLRNRMDGGKPKPSLDQNGFGYCWAHSSTQCVEIVRGSQNRPYVPLSAFSIAATVKEGRDEGGWCGLSAKFLRERGVAPQSMWPQKDAAYKKYDTPQVWLEAAKHKVTEDYVDLTVDVYDQNLKFEQVASCLLAGIPVAVDFNWWSHSVCAIELVEVEAGSFGLRILNSWSDQWGENGTGILRGSKCIPDGAVAFRVAA